MVGYQQSSPFAIIIQKVLLISWNLQYIQEANFSRVGNIYGEFKNVGAPLGERSVYVDENGVQGL